MLFREIPPNDRPSKSNFISSRWQDHQRTVLSTLDRVVAYLFALNSGALAAALAYVAAKSNPANLKGPIWLFALGLLIAVVRAAVDYYSAVSRFGEYRQEVDSFYKSAIHWEVLLDRDAKTPVADTVLHVMGWASGLLFFAGLAWGITLL